MAHVVDRPVPSVLLTRSDDVMGGEVVFAGTRVLFRSLVDYLEGGQTLDEFLDDFPAVSREHATAVLELAHESTAARAHPSR
jgi:uncharacterized protein (DUF433 family)